MDQQLKSCTLGIDDYAIDEGRKRFIRRQSLEISSLSEDGSTLNWLGIRLNSYEALEASQKLFEVIKAAASAFTKRT